MPRSTLMDREIGIEPVEGGVPHRALAAIGVLAVVVVGHVAREEAPAPVDLAVVHPVFRLVGLGVLDVGELLGGEVVEAEAVGQGHHRAAALADRHRADVQRHEVALHLRAVLAAAPDLGGAAVDPVEELVLDVPQRALAEMVLAVDEVANFDHGPILPYRSVLAMRPQSVRAVNQL